MHNKMEIDPYWHAIHDYFNLSTIPIIITFNAHLFSDFNSNNLLIYVYIFLIYVILDTLWVILKPQSVASPQTIVIHHLITIAGLVLTLALDFHFAILGSVGGLIEINKFFLIL